MQTPETEHDFTLILSGFTELTEQVENALYEAGCDDATLSMRCGRPHLTFSRLAPSRKEAILSALRDVRKTGSDAKLQQVG